MPVGEEVPVLGANTGEPGNDAPFPPPVFALSPVGETLSDVEHDPTEFM